MDDVRCYLADQTAALHRAVDARASAFDLATPIGFTSFLCFMWRGCAPVERELTRAGAGAILDEWPNRTRTEVLEAEIGDCRRPQPRPFLCRSEAEIWGALYVLEGSRLGTRALAGTTPYAASSAFFSDAVRCRYWPTFLDRLRAADRHLADRPGMAAGASRVFAVFLG